MLAVALLTIVAVSYHRRRLTPIPPLATGRTASTRLRSSAEKAPNPPRQNTGSVQIPIAPDAPPSPHLPRFPPLEVCVRRPPGYAPRHLRGAAIRKPSQQRPSAQSQLFDRGYGSARRTASGSRSNLRNCLSTGDGSPRREANPRSAFGVGPSCEQPYCTKSRHSPRERTGCPEYQGLRCWSQTGDWDMDITLVQKNVAAVAAGWSPDLMARLERSALDKADFATLREAGLTLTGVPEEMGERSAVNAPDRCDISHPRPGRSFGGVGGDHASHRAGAVA
jgi:hypothetical protein